jgi:xanthine dehydrogenase small subunit
VALDDFYVGQKRSVLQPGEFIEAIELPRPQGRHFKAHKISKRFEQDISATCAAMSWTVDGGRLKDVQAGLQRPHALPGACSKIEAVIEGRTPDEVTADELDAAIAASFTPRDGLRATWAYRALVARNLVLRFVQPELQTEGA